MWGARNLSLKRRDFFPNFATFQGYQLLNCDDHANFLRRHNKDPALYRPDICHQALLAILDSPLTKAGHLKVWPKCFLCMPTAFTSFKQPYFIECEQYFLEPEQPHSLPKHIVCDFNGNMQSKMASIFLQGCNEDSKACKPYLETFFCQISFAIKII